MKRFLLIIILVNSITVLRAQTYSLRDLEIQFLENNTSLIANKYNVDRVDAEIIQEKVWQNPTFSISEVNLWKNGGAEKMPYLLGMYGRFQQVSMELEQLIETAGKRKKRVALKSLERNTALFDYEELMRELKKELRTSYYTLGRIQKEEVQLLVAINLFEQMSVQYERQSALQNVRKADYYRIQSEMLGLQKEQIELENEKLEALAQLRILTNIATLDISQIAFSSDIPKYTPLLPYDLVEIAKEQNIGLLRQENEIDIAKGQLAIALADRKPNVTLQVNYDRGGNTMQDFIGLGASIDIPILNRNKGNIKAAKITIDQQHKEQELLENQMKLNVQQLERQVRRLETSLENWPIQQLEEQVKLIENYKKHLQNKEVTLIEFIDFTQSYREATQAYLQIEEMYHKAFEELQYIVGKDF